MSDEAAKWEGVPGASEHRTTGGRAWCYSDSEWCYDDILCPCCLEASDEYEQCRVCEGVGHVKVASPDTIEVNVVAVQNRDGEVKFPEPWLVTVCAEKEPVKFTRYLMVPLSVFDALSNSLAKEGETT